MIGKSCYFKILPLYLGVKNFLMYTLNRHNFYGVDLSKYLGQLRVHPSVAIMYAVHYMITYKLRLTYQGLHGSRLIRPSSAHRLSNSRAVSLLYRRGQFSSIFPGFPSYLFTIIVFLSAQDPIATQILNYKCKIMYFTY